MRVSGQKHAPASISMKSNVILSTDTKKRGAPAAPKTELKQLHLCCNPEDGTSVAEGGSSKFQPETGRLPLLTFGASAGFGDHPLGLRNGRSRSVLHDCLHHYGLQP